MADPRLALVTAAIHLKRHPQHPYHCRCHELAQAALDALDGPAPDQDAACGGYLGGGETCEKPRDHSERCYDPAPEQPRCLCGGMSVVAQGVARDERMTVVAEQVTCPACAKGGEDRG